MVIPHDARENSFSFKIPILLVYALIGITLFSALVVGSSLVYSSILSRRLVHYHNALAKNREQKEVIDSFSKETQKVHAVISELVAEDNELRKLLGLKSWKTKVALSSDMDKFSGKSEKISHNLKIADLQLSEREKSLDELKSWVKTVRTRYVSTPSRWPISGRIVSRFGYRVYPWRGFHTGLDISGRYGAPVRATANGVVSFAGWKRGYGRTLMIDHGHGTSTLYAHASGLAVKSGQHIKKGQVICYVGNTGYTTGPHLHYEVRKAGRPVNPVSYLNLNILTASRIWRR